MIAATLSFEAIRARIRERQARMPCDVDPLSEVAITFAQVHLDCVQLAEMVEALFDTQVPYHPDRGKAPLMVYFRTVEEREGFVAAFKQVAPLQPLVSLPVMGEK